MSGDEKLSPKVKNLTPKAQSESEAEKVKGGAQPVDGVVARFSPVDGKLIRP